MAGEVKIKIEVAGAEQAQSQIKKTSDAIDSGGTGGGSLTGSMFKGAFAAQALMKGIELVTDVMSKAIGAAVDYGKEIIKNAAYLQEYNFQLQALFDDKNELATFSASLDAIEWSIPNQSMESVYAYSKSLLVAGYSGEETIKIMQQLGDVTSVVGADKMDLFIDALTRVQQTGKLTSRQLITLSRSGLDLNEAFGLDVKSLNELDFKEVTISADDMQKALDRVTGAGGQFAGKSEEWFKTINGSFQKIDKIADQTKDHFSTMLTPAITKVLAWVVNLYDVVSQKLMVVFDKLATNPAVQTFFKNLWTVVEGVGNFIANILVGAFEFLGRVFEAIAPSLNKVFDAFGKIFGALTGIVTGDQINTVGKDMETTFTETLVATIELLATALGKVYDWLMSEEGQQAIKDVKTYIGELAGEWDNFLKILNSDDAKIAKAGVESFFSVIFAPLNTLIWLLRTAISLWDSLNGRVNGKKVGNTTSNTNTLKGTTDDTQLYHEGGFIPEVAGGNVPIIAQSGEFVIPRKIVEEIRRGDTYNNDNTKSNIININVQGGMDRRQATDTGFLFSNLLGRI